MLREHLEKKTDKYSKGSKKKLEKAIVHRLKKTFVSCLEIMEDCELTDEEFNKLRKKILGVGNDQIRNIINELEKYNVEFIPYHIEMKVKPIEGLDPDVIFQKGHQL